MSFCPPDHLTLGEGTDLFIYLVDLYDGFVILKVGENSMEIVEGFISPGIKMDGIALLIGELLQPFKNVNVASFTLCCLEP